MTPCGSEQHSEPRKKSKGPNPTLENVAEEVLNGIMCHYEPPDPNRLRPPSKRGILRQPGSSPTKRQQAVPKKHGSQPHRHSHRVRWEDEKVPTPKEEEGKGNKNDPPVQTNNSAVSCGGLGTICYEAGMEAGCVPDPDHAARHPKKKQMDAQQAIAVAKAKSPRHNGNAADELIFDEDGNLAYSDPSKRGQPPPPPPPPPPPRERELFLPQICGARINCGNGVGEQQTNRDPKMMNLRALASLSSSFDTQQGNGSAMSPNNMTYNEDDDINSLLDGIDDEEESNGDDEDISKSLSNEHSVSNQKDMTSSSARKMSRKKLSTTVDFRDLKESKDDWESHSPASSLFRRVFPLKKGTKAAKNDKTQMARRDSIDSSSEGESETSWRGRSAQRGRSRSRSRSPFRKKTIEQNGKIDRYQDRSMSPLSRLDRKNSPKHKKSSNSSSGLKFLKGLSPRSKKLSTENDWDDSIPIVPLTLSDAPSQRRLRGRSRSLSPKSSNKDTVVVSDPTSTQLPATRILPLGDARDMPLRRPEGVLQTLQPQVTFPTNNYHIHDRNEEREEDAAERLSFITAHRQGFEAAPRPPHLGTQNSLCGILSSDKNDEFERQSFITAHREAFDDSVEPNPNYPGQQLPPPQAPISDAAMDRQIFTTSQRREFEEPVHLYQPVVMLPSMHHEALRTYGMVPPPLNGQSVDESLLPPPRSSPENVPPLPDKPSRRNRSKSPRGSRSRSPSPRRTRSPSRRITNANTTDSNMMIPMPGPSILLYDPSTGTHHVAPPGYLPSLYSQPTAYPTQQIYAQSAAMPGQAQQQPTMLYPNGGFIPIACSQDGIFYGPPAIQQCFSGASVAPIINSNELASTVPVGQSVATNMDDLSWEERTRLAWERIRGGVEAAFNMEPAKLNNDKEAAPDSVSMDKKTPPTPVNQQQQQQQSITENNMSPEKGLTIPDKQTHTQLSSSSLQRNPMSIVQQPGSPPKILRTQSSEIRRVTFGEPQEHIFYDDQDENRSQMTYPDPYRRKTKRRFRGTRLISGVLGKVRHTAVSLTRSRSTDSQLSTISLSPSQDSEHGTLTQRISNLHRQPQPVNPLRDQNGRFA